MYIARSLLQLLHPLVGLPVLSQLSYGVLNGNDGYCGKVNHFDN